MKNVWLAVALILVGIGVSSLIVSQTPRDGRAPASVADTDLDPHTID